MDSPSLSMDLQIRVQRGLGSPTGIEYSSNTSSKTVFSRQFYLTSHFLYHAAFKLHFPLTAVEEIFM